MAIKRKWEARNQVPQGVCGEKRGKKQNQRFGRANGVGRDRVTSRPTFHSQITNSPRRRAAIATRTGGAEAALVDASLRPKWPRRVTRSAAIQENSFTPIVLPIKPLLGHGSERWTRWRWRGPGGETGGREVALATAVESHSVVAAETAETAAFHGARDARRDNRRRRR